jgi:hypothetical protein
MDLLVHCSVPVQIRERLRIGVRADFDVQVAVPYLVHGTDRNAVLIDNLFSEVFVGELSDLRTYPRERGMCLGGTCWQASSRFLDPGWKVRRLWRMVARQRRYVRVRLSATNLTGAAASRGHTQTFVETTSAVENSGLGTHD